MTDGAVGIAHPTGLKMTKKNKERNQEIVHSRTNGASWVSIGAQFGISRERARQIYIKETRRKEKNGLNELSVRVQNCMRNMDLTLDEIEENVLAGAAQYWAKNGKGRLRNFGLKSQKEIEIWAKKRRAKRQDFEEKYQETIKAIIF